MYGCPPPPPMYGCPAPAFVYSTYEVEVKDADTNAPIEGMRVCAILRETGIHNSATGQYESWADTLATGTTNKQGKVTLVAQDHVAATHEITADDIDGAKNGGHYATVGTEVKTKLDDTLGADGNTTYKANNEYKDQSHSATADTARFLGSGNLVRICGTSRIWMSQCRLCI